MFNLGMPKNSQLDQWRRTAEERERNQDRLGTGIGENAKKGCPDQAESDVSHRRDLNRRMGNLANHTVLDVGLRQLIGMKVERLRDKCDR